jgi:hypothetical protein
VLARLAAEIEAEGGLLAAELVGAHPAGKASLGALAAAGPRAEGREAEVALAVEAVVEGHLLHFAEGRVLRPGDRDLALLAGDRLYALGLAHLAEQGDLHAIAELSDVIALCAQARAAGDVDLDAALWEAGAAAVGWGPSPAHISAKAAAAAGDPGAADALRAAARQHFGDMAHSS